MYAATTTRPSHRGSTISRPLSATTSRSARLGSIASDTGGEAHNNQQHSPEQRAEAQRRAALSLVRAAAVLYRVPFDSLPDRVQHVTRALTDKVAFASALETVRSAAATPAPARMARPGSATSTRGGGGEAGGAAAASLFGRSASRSRRRSPGSRSRSPGNHRRPPHASAGRSWSPKRPTQVDPTNINLPQVVNEIRLRIPAMRRAAMTNNSGDSEALQLATNIGRIYTLVDTRDRGLLTLSEFASFGNRIGGATQQLLRTSEMRARLHHAFPNEYGSPLLFATTATLEDLDLEATLSASPSASVASPFGSRVFGNVSASNNINSSASGTFGSPSAASFVAPERTVMVSLRAPNPYTEPISKDRFVEAVMAAAAHKWSTLSPTVLLRSAVAAASPRLHQQAARASGTQQQIATPNTPPRPADASSPAADSQRVRPTSSDEDGNRRKPNKVKRAVNSAGVATKSDTACSHQQQQSQQNSASDGDAVKHDTASQQSSSSPSLPANPPKLQRTNSHCSSSSASGSDAATNTQSKATAIPTDPMQRQSFFAVVRLCDPQGTGYITIENLMRACPRTSAVDAVIAPAYSMRRLFDAHDVDGEGRLTIEQFAEMFRVSFMPGVGEDEEESYQRQLKAAAPPPVLAYKGRRVDWNVAL